MTNTVLREPSELVEQVARAICVANGEPEVRDSGFPEWCRYKPDARAAIAAIERLTPTPEPSLREALVEAANHLADEMDGILPYLAAHNCRIDMLAEAVTNVRSAITAIRSAASGGDTV